LRPGPAQAINVMAKRARLKHPPSQRKMRSTARAVRPSASSSVDRRVSVIAVPVAPPPAAECVALFEQAVDALHRKHFELAGERVRALLTRFPSERALLDRTRVYLQLVEREVNRGPSGPRTVEERLTAATAALNNDQDAEAERFVRAVLADEARHELALYLMAAIEARRGETESALTFLAKAISVSPEVRAQARHDSDFELLRSLDAFHALVDPPSGAAARKPPLKRHLR